MRTAFCLALLTGTSILSTAAHAQTTTPAEAAPSTATTDGERTANGTSELDTAEIVVSARKRGETLIRTPATINILQAAEVTRNNVTNANQLTGIAPGIIQSPGTSGGGATTVRGIGSSGSTQSVESSVPTYVDGVYLGHNRDYVTPLYDLDHIELIKGTQSTLLGKNTSLGAVSMVTRKPTGEFALEGSYTHSFTIDGNRFEGSLNTPVTPQLNARIALFASDEGGWYYNSFRGERAQRLRDLSGRLTLAYDLGGAQLLMTYQHDDRRARGQNALVLTDPAGIVAARARQIGQTDFRVGINHYQGDGSAPLAGTPQGKSAFDQQKTDRVNLIATVPLGDYTLTSQSAFVRWRSPRLVDLDFLAANLLNFSDLERNRVFTQEVRLASPTGERFNFLIGGFYYHNAWGLDRNNFANVNTIGFSNTGFSNVIFNEKTETLSAFGSASYEIVDNLKLTAGIRYTNEAKTADIVRTGMGSLGGATSSSPPIPFTVLPKLTANPIDGNVGVEFQAMPSLLLYATYSKGSKSGGYQENPTSILSARFEPETSYTAEVGAKYSLGATGFVTIAAFDTRVKDFQTTVFRLLGSPPFNQSTIGSSDVGSRGIEGSAAIRIFKGFSLNGDLLYDISEFRKDFGTVALKGDRLVRAPVWSGKLGADFTTPIGRQLELNIHPSVSFASKYLTQFVRDRPDSPIAKAHQLIDLRATLANKSQGWEMAVIGTNLNNDTFVITATAVSSGGTAVGNRAYYGAVNRPRTIALQFTMRI